MRRWLRLFSIPTLANHSPEIPKSRLSLPAPGTPRKAPPLQECIRFLTLSIQFFKQSNAFNKFTCKTKLTDSLKAVGKRI